MICESTQFFNIPPWLCILQNEAQVCCGRLDSLSGSMSGNLFSDRPQDTHETYSRKEGFLFGARTSTMPCKVCLFECVLDVCDDGWGDCLRLAVLKPTVLHLCYTNLWAYTIHPLLQHVGTTGKGYSTAQMTVLYFVMKVMFLCMLHTQGHCLQLHSKINVCIVH